MRRRAGSCCHCDGAQAELDALAGDAESEEKRHALVAKLDEAITHAHDAAEALADLERKAEDRRAQAEEAKAALGAAAGSEGIPTAGAAERTR